MDVVDKEQLQFPWWWHPPIWWDPIPPWLKLKEDQIKEFAAVEIKLAAKLQEIQAHAAQAAAQIKAQKIQELARIAGVQMK